MYFKPRNTTYTERSETQWRLDVPTDLRLQVPLYYVHTVYFYASYDVYKKQSLFP